MGQIKFITSIVLISLFSIALVTFAFQFGDDNDTGVKLSNDTDFINLNKSLRGNATQIYLDINTSSDAMYESTVSTQTEATEGGTAFKVGPLTALALAYSVITIGFEKIFGVDSGFGIFMTSLIAILGFISIMYLYKAWAGRNPD